MVTALSDTEAFVIMTTIPGMGPIKIRQLIDFFGSAPDALKAAPIAAAGTNLTEGWSPV